MTLMKWSYSGTAFLLSQACQWRDIWHFHVSDLHPDEAVWSALCSKHLWPRVIGERLPWWILKESLIPHLGFKRVISRGCPHVPCLKVEPVYPWALSWGHDELLLDHSFHSLLNIVLLTFPMVNFCCEPLLKQKCPLFSFLKRFFNNKKFTLLIFMLFQPSIVFFLPGDNRMKMNRPSFVISPPLLLNIMTHVWSMQLVYFRASAEGKIINK